MYTSVDKMCWNEQQTNQNEWPLDAYFVFKSDDNAENFLARNIFRRSPLDRLTFTTKSSGIVVTIDRSLG